jgi:hypothetical protein
MWDRADGDVNEGHNTWVEDVLVIRRANRSDNLGEREAQEGRTIEFFPRVEFYNFNICAFRNL